MENKTGRKYDRQRWGWKAEGDLPKHPYYDSKERIQKRKDSAMIAGWCFVGMVVIIILTAIMN